MQTKLEALQEAKVATAASIWDPENEELAAKARKLREAAEAMPDDGTEAAVKPIPIW